MKLEIEYEKSKGEWMKIAEGMLYKKLRDHCGNIDKCRSVLLNYSMKDSQKDKILSSWVKLGVWVPQSSMQDGVFDRAKMHILDDMYISKIKCNGAREIPSRPTEIIIDDMEAT